MSLAQRIRPVGAPHWSDDLREIHALFEWLQDEGPLPLAPQWIGRLLDEPQSFDTYYAEMVAARERTAA